MLDLQKLNFQVNPIFLTGGIAQGAPGGMMPMLAFTDSVAFGSNLIGAENYNLDDAFAAFQVMPGNSSLIEQQIGQYPFANNTVAANAIIRQPTDVSMLMMTPMRGANAWSVKMATITALKSTLDQHNNAGGLYTVVTPAFVYTNMVMLEFVDISMAQNPVPQNAWRLSFHRPLVSLAEAAAAQSNLMSKISSGLPTDGGNVGSTAAGSPSTSNTTSNIDPALPGPQSTFTPNSPAALTGTPPAVVPATGSGTNFAPETQPTGGAVSPFLSWGP
jgi:hypothetical protein